MKAVNQPIRKKDAMALVTGKPVFMDDLVPKDCLIMRYGGDEFVIFGSCETAQRMRRIIQRIRDLMEKENQKEKNN